MTSGLEAAPGQYHAPSFMPLVPGMVTARQAGPTLSGERLLRGRGKSTPQKRTLIFWVTERLSGLSVRAVSVVKCIMAKACRYATTFKAMNPTSNRDRRIINRRLSFGFTRGRTVRD